LSHAPPPDPRVGTVLAERYRIDSVLGEGAMGKVYAAEHVLMRKRLAVKVLHRELSSIPELVARFEREAMAAANVDHPNIAVATDFGKLPDGAVFLALELVEGRCLRDEIALGPIPMVRALHIARQVAAALGVAHAQGIVHRDLKPENVMLVDKAGDPDFVKVLDFGVARVPIGEGAAEGGGAITRAGMVFGTPEYIPPEQALGQVSDGRADLYSLGVMLFEMLTGERPFVADSKVSLVGQHLGKPPPKLTDKLPSLSVPAGVEVLVQLLLEKEVARRVQVAEEVVRAVDALIGKPTRGGFRPVRRRPEPRGFMPVVLARVGAFRRRSRRWFERYVSLVEDGIARLPRVLRRPLRRAPAPLVAAVPLFALVLASAVLIVGALRSSSEPKVRHAIARGEGVAAVAEPSAGASALVPPPVAAVAPASSVAGAALELAETARTSVAKKDYVASVAAAAQALAIDPEVRGDARLVDALFRAAQVKASANQAFELLEGPMRERGAAIQHDLAVYAPKGSPAQRRAEAFLGSPRFMARADPPLQLAVALRRARTCAEVRALLPEVKASGDKSSYPYLKFFREHPASYPCLKTDSLLADTTKIIEQRAKL
jgi:eukaryotic-like serine/threonine-protein kinase